MNEIMFPRPKVALIYEEIKIESRDSVPLRNRAAVIVGIYLTYSDGGGGGGGGLIKLWKGGF